MPLASVKKRVKMATFLDGGAVYSDAASSSKPSNSTLLSTGLGFIYSFSRRLSGRVDFGFPLRATTGISAVGVLFSMQSTLGLPRTSAPATGELKPQ